MIPQTAAPPPGTGGVQREIYCSSGFANSTPSFTRHPSPQFNTHSEHFMLCFVVYIIKSFSLPTCRPAPAGTFPITPVYRKEKKGHFENLFVSHLLTNFVKMRL
jgi:hypothetical protein